MLQADPGPGKVAWAVAVAMSAERLGTFLVQRGEPGDAEAALGYYRRALAIRESLALAEPDSEEAMRELSGCLNRLAHVLARRGEPGDTEAALAYIQRDLEISEALLRVNPDSSEAACDVAKSHFGCLMFHNSLGSGQEAAKSAAACFAILDAFVRERRSMDDEMRKLHAELASEFGKP